jgi:hypothetical protein
VMRPSQAIPRFVDEASLRADPLWFLRTAQRSAGNITVIREEQPLLRTLRFLSISCVSDWKLANAV